MNNVKSKTFQDLIVWQKAHAFILEIYALTKNYPASETYGLSAQFRRAAVSIAANIAEGFMKKGAKDKLRFYNIAQGSLNECKYFLILSRDIEYITSDEFIKLDNNLEEVSRLLNAYCRTISN